MTDIGKIRLIHDLSQNFKVPPQHADALTAQLSVEDRGKLERFSNGFQVEDWFEALYSMLPWAMLVHGLSQRQLPTTSKSEYQVPDFLAVLETTSMQRLPILVETKRVAKPKQSLHVKERQFSVAVEYARCLGMPLVYATYWDKLGAWTVSTPDMFREKKSERTLAMLHALECDCSLIFGDVSYLVSKPIDRVSVYSASVRDPRVTHPEYGPQVSDRLTYAGKVHELNAIETAIVNSVFDFDEISVSCEDGSTTVHERSTTIYAHRLSVWVSRHLALYGWLPKADNVNMSAVTISQLTERLGIGYCHIFPFDLTEQAINLQTRFLGIEQGRFSGAPGGHSSVRLRVVNKSTKKDS